MALTWNLSDIRTKVRTITGLLSTSQKSNDDIDNEINDYYQNTFPLECEPEKLKDWLTQATSVDDDGEYDVADTVLKLKEPVTINGSNITLYQDTKKFFDLYPKDTGSAYSITDPGLAIGSSSKAAVASSAFSYRTQNYSYPKATAETALSGDTIPQNKYGAWRLEIDSDGTISIVEAGGNATGYDTAAKAVEGLSNESSSNACMGYVTAMSTDSGGFVPGTTGLDASGVTKTFTDHFNSSRNRPEAALLSGEVLHLRPKANDIFEFKARTIEKPTALSGDTAVLLPEWGRLIAYGAAILILEEKADDERLAKAGPVYEHLKTLIGRKDIRQKSVNQRTSPRF